jgi:hypothetical protein
MVYTSKNSDRKMARPFQDIDYIDEKYVLDLLKLQESYCTYCHNRMAYGKGINRKSDLMAVTIQRIDNSIAHIKSNCVLSCALCNQRAQNIPHDIMKEHGSNIREEIFSYCSCEYHQGDRVVTCQEWSHIYCKKCAEIKSKKAYERLKQNKQQ